MPTSSLALDEVDTIRSLPWVSYYGSFSQRYQSSFVLANRNALPIIGDSRVPNTG
jgi:hypothetical protein